MALLDIVWMGVQTERFDDMAAFVAKLTGMPPPVREPGFAMWDLPSGDLVELFAAGTKPPFGAAPVVGFLVTDIEAARAEVESAGGVIVGGYGPNADGYVSVQFKAPDGNIYEVIHDPRHAARRRRRRRSMRSGAAPAAPQAATRRRPRRS